MQDDLERLSVGCQDNKVGEASVQRFGGLIGTLLQLYHLTKRRVSKVSRGTKTPYAINSIIRNDQGIGNIDG